MKAKPSTIHRIKECLGETIKNNSKFNNPSVYRKWLLYQNSVSWVVACAKWRRQTLQGIAPSFILTCFHKYNLRKYLDVRWRMQELSWAHSYHLKALMASLAHRYVELVCFALPGVWDPGAVCPSLWGAAGYPCCARSQNREREVCRWRVHHDGRGLHQRQWACHSGGHIPSSWSELLQDVWDHDWEPRNAAEAVCVSEFMGSDHQNDWRHDHGTWGQHGIGVATTSGLCTGNYRIKFDATVSSKLLDVYVSVVWPLLPFTESNCFFLS